MDTKDQLVLKKIHKLDKNEEKKKKSLVEKGSNKKTLFKKIKKLKKIPLPQNVIDLFYDQPTQFFTEFKSLLENTSLFDYTNTSIFMHYFNILYNQYKHQNDNQEKKYDSNYEIYEKNFDKFFKEEGKFLSIQDFTLDTPLHKLARIDKVFFLKICDKLKKLEVLNQELLTIKNIKEENCYNYIIKEIEEKRNIIINKDYYDLYKNFINYFPDLMNTLPKSTKNNVIIFSLKLNLDIEQLKGKDFNEIYNSINKLLQNNNNGEINNFEYLYYPLTSGINYFNYLFNICQVDDDYTKIKKLILELLNKKNNEDKKDFSLFESCIIHHISNVLGKMNSIKIKGEKEIEYGINLINEVFTIIIKDKTEKNIKKILSNKTNSKIKKDFSKDGIIDSLVFNPNLNFDKKNEILKILNDKTNGITEEFIDKDFLCICKLFEICDKNEINETNIINIFNENKYFQKIFSDYYFIVKLYKLIYDLCNKYDKNNMNNFISKLNEFLNNIYIEIFSNYKTRYGLSNTQIKKILDLIILYEKQNLLNGTMTQVDSKIEGKIDFYTDKLYKQFISNDEKLILYTLEDLLDKLISDKNEKKFNKDIINFFIELFFSFKYDFVYFVNNNKESLFNYFNQNKKYVIQIYTKFLSKAMDDIKVKPFELFFYNFFLNLSFYIKDINVLSNITNFYSKLNILIRRYLISLILNWENPCEFKELSNLISNNILPFCPLLINNKDSLEENNTKINFFFDEFINALGVQIQQNIVYKNLFLKYAKSYKGENNIEPNHIYLAIMLIFIRIKFGVYNPEVLVLYVSFFKKESYRKILINFIECYLKNENRKDIPYNFLLADCNLFNENDEEYSEYESNKINISKLCSQNNINSTSNNKYDEIMQKIIKEGIPKYFSIFLTKMKIIEFSLVYDYLQNSIKISVREINNDYKKEDKVGKGGKDMEENIEGDMKNKLEKKNDMNNINDEEDEKFVFKTKSKMPNFDY